MKPTIEEVREYFKDALEVRCAADYSLILKFSNVDFRETTDDGGGFYYTGETPNGVNHNKYAILFSISGSNKYAEITKYKTKGVKNPEAFETRYKDKEVNGMDVIDLIKHWDLNFNEGNVLKYLLRDKGDRIGDLKKIVDYTNRELNHLNK